MKDTYSVSSDRIPSREECNELMVQHRIRWQRIKRGTIRANCRLSFYCFPIEAVGDLKDCQYRLLRLV
jgi:hypothetical protein